MDDDSYGPLFTITDHTELVKAVLERPLHIIKYLDVPKGQAPTTQQVLEAALQVRAFDAATKARLEAALAGYLLFEEHADAASNERGKRVHDALEGKSVPEMIATLDELLVHEDSRDTSAGIRLARDILVDGADSIYSSDSPEAELLEGSHTHAGPTGAQQVAQQDAAAAAISQMIGESYPGVAAAPGAISVATAVVVIYQAFFG